MMTCLQRLMQAATCRPYGSRVNCQTAVMLETLIQHPCHLLTDLSLQSRDLITHEAVSTNYHDQERSKCRRQYSNSLRTSRVSWKSHCRSPTPTRMIKINDPSLRPNVPSTVGFTLRSFTTSTVIRSLDDVVNQTQANSEQHTGTVGKPCKVTTSNTTPTSETGATNPDVSASTAPNSNNEFKMPDPELPWEYIINPENEETIQLNINIRRSVGDIHKVKKLWNSLNYPEEIEVEEHHEDLTKIKRALMKEALSLPNLTHPDVPIGDESQNRLVETVGTKRVFNFRPKTVVQLGEKLDMLRTENLGLTTGPKTYYLMGGLAQLEQALIRYTVNTLEKHGFTLMSVPDLIHPDIVERCGFKATGERTQVYKLDPRGHGDVALAGTGEMPIAGMFMGQRLDANELPKKVMTVSRCYRAETSDIDEERGLYRVHHFTKVEAFGLTSKDTGTESEVLVDEVLDIQRSLFKDLGLHFRILEMASEELGAPAYRKYDMETWMPGKQFWGEISSTSNCIDYQSRRLSIKYSAGDSSTHVHTINGTACAVPRMIMAIVENNQLKDGRVEIPPVLHPYMDGTTILEKAKHPLIAKWIRFTKLNKSRAKSS